MLMDTAAPFPPPFPPFHPPKLPAALSNTVPLLKALLTAAPHPAGSQKQMERSEVSFARKSGFFQMWKTSINKIFLVFLRSALAARPRDQMRAFSSGCLINTHSCHVSWQLNGTESGCFPFPPPWIWREAGEPHTAAFYPLYPSNHVPSFTQCEPSLQILANLSWFGWNSGQNGVGQVDEESVLVAVWICTALQSESPSPRVDEARE